MPDRHFIFNLFVILLFIVCVQQQYYLLWLVLKGKGIGCQPSPVLPHDLKGGDVHCCAKHQPPPKTARLPCCPPPVSALSLYACSQHMWLTDTLLFSLDSSMGKFFLLFFYGFIRARDIIKEHWQKPFLADSGNLIDGWWWWWYNITCCRSVLLVFC